MDKYLLLINTVVNLCNQWKKICWFVGFFFLNFFFVHQCSFVSYSKHQVGSVTSWFLSDLSLWFSMPLLSPSLVITFAGRTLSVFSCFLCECHSVLFFVINFWCISCFCWHFFRLRRFRTMPVVIRVLSGFMGC